MPPASTSNHLPLLKRNAVRDNAEAGPSRPRPQDITKSRQILTRPATAKAEGNEVQSRHGHAVDGGSVQIFRELRPTTRSSHSPTKHLQPLGGVRQTSRRVSHDVTDLCSDDGRDSDDHPTEYVPPQTHKPSPGGGLNNKTPRAANSSPQRRTSSSVSPKKRNQPIQPRGSSSEEEEEIENPDGKFNATSKSMASNVDGDDEHDFTILDKPTPSRSPKMVNRTRKLTTRISNSPPRRSTAGPSSVSHSRFSEIACESVDR